MDEQRNKLSSYERIFQNNEITIDALKENIHLY